MGEGGLTHIFTHLIHPICCKFFVRRVNFLLLFQLHCSVHRLPVSFRTQKIPLTVSIRMALSSARVELLNVLRRQ